MFFSADLLSRRSPLGAIWMVAHGKKLSKGKLLGISVQDICDEVLHPDVPHSLRLQGILVGGVVVVFSKQQTYLWEDVQEMMRRVKEAMNAQQAAQGKATLKQGKGNKHQSTTLMEEAEADLMLDGLNNAMTQAAGVHYGFQSLTQRQLGGWPLDLTQLQDAELFAAPAVSGRTQSGLTRSKGGQGAADEAGGHARQQDLLRGAGRQRFVSLAASDEDPNELFAMPGEDPGLADELAAGLVMGIVDEPTEEHMNDIADINQAAAVSAGQGSKHGSKTTGSAPGASRNKGSSLSRNPSAAEPSAPTESDMELDLMNMNLDPAAHPPPMEDMEAPLSEAEEQERSAARARVAAELRDTYNTHDDEVLASEDEGEEERKAKRAKRANAATAAAAGGAKVKVTKRKAKLMLLPMDEPEEILVKAKEFREWTLDTSDIVRKRPLGGGKGTLGAAAAGGATAVGPVAGPAAEHGQPLTASEEALLRLTAAGGLLPSNHGLPAGLWSNAAPAVQELSRLGVGTQLKTIKEQCLMPLVSTFHTSVAARTTRVNKKAKLTHPAQEDYTTPSAATGKVGHLASEVTGADEPLLEEEMHDTLHELPFGGDVEVERLRAASLSPGVGGRLAPRAGSDIGSGDARLLAQDLLNLGTGTKGSALSSGTSRDSMLGSVPHRARAGSVDLLSAPGSGLLLPGSSRLGSKRRGTGAGTHEGSDSGLLRWGTATLEDLMPDLGMGLCDLTLRADTGSGGESLALAGSSSHNALAASASGSEPGSLGREHLVDGTWKLVETSGDGDPSQQMAQQLTSRNSVTVVRLVQHMLSEQQAAGTADPAVSFLDLAQRLTRFEAVKLFMQVLVTQTACYTKASQTTPYGDILIRAGRRMQV